MKNSFTTICLLRNIFLATMCTWSSVNVERWPLWDMTFFLQQLLWDMTILRLDIFPTSTIMRHDHFETWNFSHTNHYEKRPFWDMFFCNYITWSTNIFFPLLVRPTISTKTITSWTCFLNNKCKLNKVWEKLLHLSQILFQWEYKLHLYYYRNT